MREWLESVAGPAYASAMMWTLGALALLLVVLVLIKIVRSLTFGTFVAGGRNRKARLAVMDAAAVDSQRRLVLVRRDDVEHLILIGGPTDVVVEQNIRLLAPARRAPAPEPVRAQPRPVPAPEPAPSPAARPVRATASPYSPPPRRTEPQAPRVASPSTSASPATSQPAKPQTQASPARIRHRRQARTRVARRHGQ